MEPTLRPPSMRSKDNFPSYGFFLVFAILLGIGLAILFHSDVKKWFREKFGKYISRISSCLRICECGSEEANERGADDEEQLELNDLVNEQLDIHPQQNRDNLRPHRGRRPFELRDLQNNLIEFRPDDGHLRDPRPPQLPIGLRELQNYLINLRPHGDIGGEHRVYGLPEIVVEMRNLRNNLGNLPNGDVRRNQERSL